MANFPSHKNNVFDIIVIGAGAGGLNIAGFMNRAGFRTLLIERDEKRIGGDCLNFGCVPSKSLLHIAKMIHSARQSTSFGWKLLGRTDMEKVRSYITERQEMIRQHENAQYFRKQGMMVVIGEARFSGRDAVEVSGQVYRAKKIVLAAGLSPRKLNVPGIENVAVYHNENIFQIDYLPKKMVVIGGGPVGIEIGQAFQYLGSEVTVVQNSDIFLKKEDPEITRILLSCLQRDGMRFFFNSEPMGFPSPRRVMIRSKNDGKTTTLEFDALFVSIGRELKAEHLQLEKAGIKTEDGRILVDPYLRTTNKNIFLCGDIAQIHQFTHAAEHHARLILRNFFSPWKKKLNTAFMAWVTYTHPEIATFGLSERQLKEQGREFEVLRLDFKKDDRAVIDDYTYGMAKIFVSGGRILGGSIIAPSAGEVVQELILANTLKIPLKKLFSKIYPYPTASRVNRQIAADYLSRKLTVFSKTLLRWLYNFSSW